MKFTIAVFLVTILAEVTVIELALISRWSPRAGFSGTESYRQRPESRSLKDDNHSSTLFSYGKHKVVPDDENRIQGDTSDKDINVLSDGPGSHFNGKKFVTWAKKVTRCSSISPAQQKTKTYEQISDSDHIVTINAEFNGPADILVFDEISKSDVSDDELQSVGLKDSFQFGLSVTNLNMFIQWKRCLMINTTEQDSEKLMMVESHGNHMTGIHYKDYILNAVVLGSDSEEIIFIESIKTNSAFGFNDKFSNWSHDDDSQFIDTLRSKLVKEILQEYYAFIEQTIIGKIGPCLRKYAITPDID